MNAIYVFRLFLKTIEFETYIFKKIRYLTFQPSVERFLVLYQNSNTCVTPNKEHGHIGADFGDFP